MSGTTTLRARTAAATVVVLALSMALQVTPASAGPSAPCRVTNLDTRVSRHGLQPAVTAADPGDRLTVKGTCHGVVVIHHDLTIRGVQTRSSGRPTLDGDDAGPVVTVDGGISVTLSGLRIWDGAGGVANIGRLTLRDVVVRGSRSEQGAGIYNHASGTLILRGSSSVRDNRADWQGAGVVNVGTLVLRDQAVITSNSVIGVGGNGGGVRNTGLLVMRDQATITGNDAGNAGSGGGVMNAGSFDGVTCAPGADANVFGNTPDDCSP
jgi:nitrous oxidase accessory protein NosD